MKSSEKSLLGMATMMLSIIPLELIIEKLEEAITTFKVTDTDESRINLESTTAALAMKLSNIRAAKETNKDEMKVGMERAEEIMKESEWSKLNPEKNKQ